MTGQSSFPSWSLAAKTLHWLTVILIVVEVPVGLSMAYTFGPAFKAPAAVAFHNLMEQAHHTIGFTILLLVALRLISRFTTTSPALPANTPVPVVWAARASHGVLYLWLALIPLSGWAALSVAGDTKAFGHIPIWLFGRDGLIPPLLHQRPLTDPFGYRFFATAHILLLISGGALLTLHVAAALWHHFGRRDVVLARMWPLGRAPGA